MEREDEDDPYDIESFIDSLFPSRKDENRRIEEAHCTDDIPIRDFNGFPSHIDPPSFLDSILNYPHQILSETVDEEVIIVEEVINNYDEEEEEALEAAFVRRTMSLEQREMEIGRQTEEKRKEEKEAAAKKESRRPSRRDDGKRMKPTKSFTSAHLQVARNRLRNKFDFIRDLGERIAFDNNLEKAEKAHSKVFLQAYAALLSNTFTQKMIDNIKKIMETDYGMKLNKEETSSSFSFRPMGVNYYDDKNSLALAAAYRKVVRKMDKKLTQEDWIKARNLATSALAISEDEMIVLENREFTEISHAYSELKARSCWYLKNNDPVINKIKEIRERCKEKDRNVNKKLMRRFGKKPTPKRPLIPKREEAVMDEETTDEDEEEEPIPCTSFISSDRPNGLPTPSPIPPIVDTARVEAEEEEFARFQDSALPSTSTATVFNLSNYLPNEIQLFKAEERGFDHWDELDGFLEEPEGEEVEMVVREEESYLLDTRDPQNFLEFDGPSKEFHPDVRGIYPTPPPSNPSAQLGNNQFDLNAQRNILSRTRIVPHAINYSNQHETSNQMEPSISHHYYQSKMESTTPHPSTSFHSAPFFDAPSTSQPRKDPTTKGFFPSSSDSWMDEIDPFPSSSRQAEPSQSGYMAAPSYSTLENVYPPSPADESIPSHHQLSDPVLDSPTFASLVDQLYEEPSSSSATDEVFVDGESSSQSTPIPPSHPLQSPKYPAEFADLRIDESLDLDLRAYLPHSSYFEI